MRALNCLLQKKCIAMVVLKEFFLGAGINPKG